MSREEMLVEMLKKADEEIKTLKEQLAFMHKELNAHYELLNAVGQAAFMGNH